LVADTYSHSDLVSAIIRITPYPHLRILQRILTIPEKSVNFVYENFPSFYWK